MSAGELTFNRKAGAARKKRGAADAALQDAIAQRIHGSLLPGEGPHEGSWVDETARFLLAAGQCRKSGEPVIEVATASEERRLLRIALINDDMPFLVDSVAAAIAELGLVIDRLAHPVLSVERDADGQLVAIPESPTPDSQRESMIYIETPRVDARQRRELMRLVEATLADVRYAVSDWQRMVEIMHADAGTISDEEGAELLRWFADGMLTQLGHVTRSREGSQSQRLGICRRPSNALLSEASYAAAFAAFDAELKAGRICAPMVVKANQMGTVHRRVPMDLFLVPVIDKGMVTALSVHAGVWTSASLTASPDSVPRLRGQLAALTARLGLDPLGHTGKALAHALTSLPHDLLLGLGTEDVERLATTMIGLVDRPRPRLLITRPPLMRHLFAFVWLPRDMVSTDMRKRIQAMIEDAAQAPALDWSLQVESGNLAMLRFTIDIREGVHEPDEDELDRHLQVMLRGWSEAVEAVLMQTLEPARAAAAAGRYADAFPLAYRSDYGPAEAAIDIGHMRKIMVGEAADSEHEKGHRDVRLYAHDGDQPGRLRLKIYEAQGSLPLSDAVPALENFGFRVLEEVPTPLAQGRFGTIHDFTLALPVDRDAGEVLRLAPMIEDALCGVLNGLGENDAFNRLVPGLGLSKRETNWLRAWYRYLRQAGVHYGIVTVVDALQGAPAVTLGLIDLFRVHHDPDFSGDRALAGEAAEEAIRTGLVAVSAINDDRLLRAYRALVKAMLRTNAFAPAGDVALAFKLASAQVPDLPKPVPWREIFVYSRRVEGIHLRAGPIARGGLRWSDRRDDYRTEILGLMKAQRVKNAVIVPTGAKGGFYPKQLPDPAHDRAGWAAEGQGAYQVFVDTLLSVTDNIVAGKVVHPDAVMVLDGDDPYFVVAADKGTAKFSDVANAIAAERDFWLDDAFASGGSNGYDHKAMGITARGAWVSVQRHFLELGVDVQTEPVRVAGCGDMSGDVFGNGMLLSQAIKLVAAFDHRHIFLDPDPDPARSWAERKRMFGLPMSSWADYDQSLISQGGGVFPRTLKAIPLSPEVRHMLGIDATEIDPDSLISAILRARLDLLWFGGIGTYIKASSENNATVGDPTNDVLRVSANEVHAKVIGEGANLGVTQAGRIEFALKGRSGLGGCINADFIDNSAGVDCSDNEVNIKIALAAARRAGKLSEKARVDLLREMTDEVSALVLEDNRLQALALSIAGRGGADALPSHIRLIEMLEEGGHLDRLTEGLAENEDFLRRAQDGQGLTRPELAVLLSSTKLLLQDAIEGSDLPGDSSLSDMLLAAFPVPMQDKFQRFIKDHRLAREIIATKLANRIVNRLGIVHPFELAEEEGADLAQVAAAFVLAERLFGLDRLWHLLETAPMPEAARITLFDRVAVAVRGHMADLLRAGAGTVAPAELGKRLQGGITALSTDTIELLGERTLAHSLKLRAGLLELGVPEAVAVDVGNLFDLDGAVGIAELSAGTGIGPRDLVAAFTRIGAGLGLDWAQASAAIMSPSDPWERLLVAGLARDFQQMRLDFLKRLAGTKQGKKDPLAAAEAWGSDHMPAIGAFRSMVHRAEHATLVTPAMLAQIASQARNLLGR
ncbi:NAD-glutamate dehydrogenase [Novosphingobium mangrovi (ex Huang et al. 2023)]|uniref:NAD-glutamate dehydrogenase n=1 Tax=Novosphingobium mangrovi (ex Huang et al. 2023) TaxID=2976432 RepID=A0ABT2I312_9SPHN|nr:NAD-glutamate dehydrogenase [Novosphingobium mangrovi (ex Huang et al. 2023)]MCT2398997.1 NAD-glutamate dehydrogenase [Novosphingobium mangrovi (ex Huang et al. 2023)]